MGIEVEFNPDLALRKFGTSKRLEEECLPKNITEGKIYSFLKKGQRNYWLKGEIPLRMTEGNEKLSEPIGSIQILEATHYLVGENVWTKGVYKIIKIIKKGERYFNGLDPITK